MATIEDYVSGKAARAVKAACDAMAGLDGPLTESPLAAAFEKAVAELAPVKVDLDEAARLIRGARRRAVGERICRSAVPDSPVTWSVYLDELAEALVEAGCAEFVSEAEAIDRLAKQKGHPIVVSRVSGRPLEICRTVPRHCFYWNMERHGLRCLDRRGCVPGALEAPHRKNDQDNQTLSKGAVMAPGEEVWKMMQEHLGYSDEEMQLFRSNPKNVDIMDKAPQLMEKTIVATVVDSHGCNSRHKKGDRFLFDGAGNLLSKHNPGRICVHALSALSAPIYVANELFYAGADPNDMRLSRVGCFDVGVRCGGWGHIVMEVTVVDRKHLSAK